MINPILASSARRRMRSMRAPLMVTLYTTLILLFAFATVYYRFLSPTVTISSMRAGVEGYAMILVLQFVLLILVTPAITSGSISGERERQTLEMLLVTNMGSVRIVLGKLLEAFGFLALLIISSLPVISLTLIAGGVTIVQALTGILFLVVTAFASLSVGLFCSSVFKRSVTATVVSYLSVFAIGIITLLPLLRDSIVLNQFYAQNNYSFQTLTEFVPLGFVFNPFLGLAALIMDQTQLLGGSLLGFSYTLSSAYNSINFGKCAWLCMVFMAGAGTVLTLLSALFVRPLNHAHKARKGKA